MNQVAEGVHMKPPVVISVKAFGPEIPVLGTRFKEAGFRHDDPGLLCHHGIGVFHCPGIGRVLG
jgi:hypothetical protein